MPENRGERDDRAIALAFAALAAALLARYLLVPWLGVSMPFVTVFAAVAAAARVGGFRAATVVTILGYLGTSFTLGPWESGPLGFAELGGLAGLAAYVFTSGLIIAFGDSARSAALGGDQSRALLRLALEKVDDAVITTNAYGRIIAMNPAAQSLTGWCERAALDRPLEQVFRIADAAGRAPGAHPAPRHYSVLTRRDGSQREIDQSATPLQDEHGEVSGCLLVFRDISEQLRLDRERASTLASTRLLAAVVDASNDAVVALSLDGTIRSWNPAAESLYGYSAAEAIGSRITMVMPDERRSEHDAIVARIASGRKVEHFITESVRGDGTRVLVSLTVSPIRNEHGHVIGASQVARDITDRLAAQQRERELEAERARLEAALVLAGRRAVE